MAKHIVFIDNSEQELDVVRRLIEAYGDLSEYKVDYITDPLTLYVLLDAITIDCVVVDLYMDVSGSVVADKIRTDHPETSVVFFTNLSVGHDYDEAKGISDAIFQKADYKGLIGYLENV